MNIKNQFIKLHEQDRKVFYKINSSKKIIEMLIKNISKEYFEFKSWGFQIEEIKIVIVLKLN